MSEVWYSASEGGSDSDSDKDEKRDWIQERARSMSWGRGSVRPSDHPAQAGRDIPLMARAYVGEGNPLTRSYIWENPLELAGIGRGLSSAEVMRQATVSYFRLLREEAVREPPVTESKGSVMASKEPVVFRGRSRSREARPVAISGMFRISRPSGDVEFPPGRKDYRDSLAVAYEPGS